MIAAYVQDEGAGRTVTSGASIASMLKTDGSRTLPSGTVTSRVLRHLQRLDEGVAGLARPLDIPVADRTDAKTVRV